MKEIENRDGTLEVQEELFRLEREKTIALENPLVIEKKGFKVQENLLKEKRKKFLVSRNLKLKRSLRTMCGSRTGGWSLPCVMSD
jgi:speckle-type POZ protein